MPPPGPRVEGGGMGWHVSPFQAADILSVRIRSRAPSYLQKGQKLVFEWSCDPDQISITVKGKNGLMRSVSVSIETWHPMKIGLVSLCICLSVALLFSRKPQSSYWLPYPVQSLSHVWPFTTPWTAGHQASLSSTISQSLQVDGNISELWARHCWSRMMDTCGLFRLLWYMTEINLP